MIKQVFVIVEKTLSQTYEIFGKNGCLTDNNNRIMLLDFVQMGQYVLENADEQVYDGEIDKLIVSKKEMKKMTKKWAENIAEEIIEEVYANALSDAEDDEEIKVIE